MRMLRSTCGAILTTLAALSTVPLVPGAAAAQETPAYEQVVDITFPADPRVTYRDDYDSPRSRGSHGATDLAGEKGWGVYAAVGGTVVWAPGSDGAAMPAYGYMIRILGSDGRKYSYVHLNNDTPGTDDGQGGARHAFAPGVVHGATISRGQLIGYLGDSGNAEGTTPHLHFEIEDPEVVDPDGTHRINPFFSLNDAEARGDFPDTGAAVTPTEPAGEPCPEGEVPPHGFTDVPPGSTHDGAIGCALWWQLASGASDTTFAPARDVTRAQLATLLTRLVLEGGGALPTSPADQFGDDDGSVHEANINRLAAAGVVGGVGDGRFAPEQPVTRAQMATLLVHAYEHTAGVKLPVGVDAFTDDDGHVHESHIDQAAAAGIAAGIEPGRYAPGHFVSRGQMASFLVRVLELLVADGRATPP